jgi:ATP-dependent phosphofructokinase / diphosphate-dependent phosphofructokinase
MSNINTIKGTIAILTGGGDVPGLNPAIRALTVRALREGYRVLGIRRGWAGLVEFERDKGTHPEGHVIELSEEAVNKVGRTGGTFLHTSRTNPSKVSQAQLPPHLKEKYPGDIVDVTPDVLANLESLGVDTLIPIGGDDTLSYGVRLHKEGVRVIAIPKTMDNDVHGTDYCIGFSTAITRTVIFIHQLRTSAGSHERLAVVEVFGRYSGETSLVSAYLSGVDRAIISEVPFDIQRLAELLTKDKAANPSRYAMMTISEGATMVGGEMVQGGPADAYGHRKLGGIGQTTSEFLKEITGDGIIYQQLGYLMRSGSPDSLDLMVAINYAVMAADLVIEGTTGRLVALRNGNYANVPLGVTRQGVKRVDVDALYDSQNYLPKIRHVDGKPMFLY